MIEIVTVLLLGLLTLLIGAYGLGGLELATFCLGAVCTAVGLIMFAIGPEKES